MPISQDPTSRELWEVRSGLNVLTRHLKHAKEHVHSTKGAERYFSAAIGLIEGSSKSSGLIHKVENLRELNPMQTIHNLPLELLFQIFEFAVVSNDHLVLAGRDGPCRKSSISGREAKTYMALSLTCNDWYKEVAKKFWARNIWRFRPVLGNGKRRMYEKHWKLIKRVEIEYNTCIRGNRIYTRISCWNNEIECDYNSWSFEGHNLSLQRASGSHMYPSTKKVERYAIELIPLIEKAQEATSRKGMPDLRKLEQTYKDMEALSDYSFDGR